MKSPFTGGEAVRHKEMRTAVFRKETFNYVFVCYKCVDTGEMFTTEEMDVVNMAQIYNQYRVKYGIPFPDEIRSARTKYGLSAARMSLVLGFGENQYRLYENGEMPSVANGRILQAIQTPSTFKTFVMAARNSFTQDDYEKIAERVDEVSSMEKCESRSVIKSLMFSVLTRSRYNGYAFPSVSKVKNAMLFFIDRFNGVFITQMNKLLFYLDLLSYRERGIGFTGLTFKAVQYGPVPLHWERVYSLTDDIFQEPVESKNGNNGTVLKSLLDCDEACFDDEEKKLLEKVYQTFKNDTPTTISQKSHKEDAWIDNKDRHAIIDYDYAFSIKAI